MMKSGPLAGAIALAGIMLAGGAGAPALAAPADVALLQTFVGNWSGRGEIVGSDRHCVRCRMTLSSGNQGKVNYHGTCTLGGAQLSVAGTIAYIEAQQRYEAAMTTNASFTGVAIGQKRGNGLVFNLRERETDDAGTELSIAAQIVLRPDAINVVFDVMDIATGDSLRAEVPFDKT